jgi:hypothetical protein
MKAVEVLKVVNDVAERAIALMTNYNENLTKNKASKQNLLHVVTLLFEVIVTRKCLIFMACVTKLVKLSQS